MSNKLSKIKTVMANNPEFSANEAAISIAFNLGRTVTVKEVSDIQAWAVCDWEDKVIALFIKEDNVHESQKD